MASTILYPPVIESLMPTFVNTDEEVKVFFSISDYNTLNNFARIGATETVVSDEIIGNIPQQQSSTVSPTTNQYDIYSSEDEKLYHLFLDEYQERGWRRFYCSAPLKYTLEAYNATNDKTVQANAVGLLKSATLGPMMTNPATTYEDLDIDINWAPTFNMVLDLRDKTPGTIVVDGETITDDFRVLLPNNEAKQKEFELYKGAYVYPDIAEIKKRLEEINASSNQEDYNITPEQKQYVKYHSRQIAGSSYSGEALIPTAAQNYVYPWTMVTCTGIDGTNYFNEVVFPEAGLVDSGIHFYPMYRDEIKYNKGESNCYYIIIKNSDIINGFSPDVFYQIQIRFLDKNISLQTNFPSEDVNWMQNNINYFSEWSTVCNLKCIYHPLVRLDDEIENIQYNAARIYPFTGAIFNCHFMTIKGWIEMFQDKSGSIETLKDLKFVLVDKDFNIVEDSGWIQKDKVSNPDSDQLNSFIYMFKQRFKANILYHLFIYYRTNNGYEDCSYSFVSKEDTGDNIIYNTIQYADIKISILSDLQRTNTKIDVVSNDEDGQVLIKLKTQDPFSGKVTILRTSSDSNFTEWEKIVEINNLKSIDTIYWIDRTVQSDKWYEYATIYRESFTFNKKDYKYVGDVIQEYTRAITRTLETDSVYDKEPIGVFLNDSFLIGDYKQLKVKFDPIINNFKWKVTEGFVETLGNQYPFYNRNAVINYRTFPISGTISCWMDDEENFGTRDSFFSNSELPFHRQQVDTYNIEAHQDWLLEKRFRDEVAAFLMNSRPKLFKSLTEGNILIKIHDITFTPNKVLGRRIWAFNGTATEIGECTIDNLDHYQIQDKKIDLVFQDNSESNKLTLRYDKNEDLSVTPMGFYILHDKKAKELTEFLIGKEAMLQYNIRLSRPINSDTEGGEVDKLDIVENLIYTDLKEDS